MPYKNPEDRKAHDRLYYQANKSNWKNADGSWKENQTPEQKRESNRKSYQKHIAARRAKINEYDKRVYYKKTYGISREDFEALVNSQNNKCAICSREARLVMDHCHATNKLREALCHQCNVMLGMAQDDERILKNAIKYIRKHK